MVFLVMSVLMRSPLFMHPFRLRVAGVPVAGLLVMASAGAYGQTAISDAGPSRALSIVPRVSISETLTDNVRLSSTGQQSDQITEISPGIRIRSEGARLKGYFDYAINEIVYAQNSSPSRTQNALTTFGTLEAVDNWAYLDFSGSISQQTISAFGAPSTSNSSLNPNQSEVSSYRVSPYVRGRLGDMARYEARYSRAVTQSDSAVGSGVATSDGVVNISGDSAFRNLGWSADASQQTIDYSTGRPTEADRLSLGLSYAITSQLSVSANAGRETNNYTSIDKKDYGTSGVGVNWSPSENTKVSAALDHRSFGDTHSLSFEHRTARTAWKFTDSKDVTATPSQTGIASIGSVYELLYSQFAAIEPNPTARAQLVNAYMQANNISPSANVTSSFLTSTLSLTRRQDLLFALLGVRDTVTFVASRSESSRLDTISSGVDDLSTSSLIRQRGISVNYTHRLTPDYSLGVLVSQQKTSGDSSLQDATLRLLNVNVTGRVGKRTTASVGIRRVSYSGNTAPYEETAVTVNLNVQF